MKKKNKKPINYLLDFALAALITSSIVVGSGILIHTQVTHRGTFGDMFGAVNALFSGLAFAGVIITMIMQRDEMSESREVFEQQVREMEKQTFLSTYDSLKEILDNEKKELENEISSVNQKINNIVVDIRGQDNIIERTKKAIAINSGINKKSAEDALPDQLKALEKLNETHIDYNNKINSLTESLNDIKNKIVEHRNKLREIGLKNPHHQSDDEG